MDKQQRDEREAPPGLSSKGEDPESADSYKKAMR